MAAAAFLLQDRGVTLELSGKHQQEPINATRTAGRDSCCSPREGCLPTKLTNAHRSDAFHVTRGHSRHLDPVTPEVIGR